MQIACFFLIAVAAVTAQGCHSHEGHEELISSACNMLMDGTIPYITDFPIPEGHAQVSYIEEDSCVLDSLVPGPIKRAVLSDTDDATRRNNKKEAALSKMQDFCSHFLETVFDEFVPVMIGCDEATLATHDVATMYAPALPTTAFSELVVDTTTPTGIITTSNHLGNESSITTETKSAHAAPHQTGVIMAAAALAVLVVADIH